MNELETRIIKIDVANIRHILVENGANKVKEENQINNIYDFEDDRLLKNRGYARIRTIDDLLNKKEIYFMTTKKLISQGRFKEMEENEILVEDKTAAEGIFNSLGLILKQSIKKFRESYELEDGLVEIDINDATFCPFPYIEIETDSEKKLERIVKLLGYTMEDTTSKTIYELIEENK
ncbi:CYTH domain-containing protein [Clostridium sp. SHJSY1]|uniref:class IV adenylate cyclase n=1 Tax=Clostridium sp. SHJSY1 TaxID=2942483 RepID=UPI0028750DC4|nr:CYTH domain-containing protein [Clostridium sp. SHJSY1]MDS0525532.1 CYTH domain-containing protein [Clostridium sp. SHJSY1]